MAFGIDPWSDLPWPDQLRPEVDHKVPQNCGGSDADSNLQIAHAACNRHKHFDPQPPPEQAQRYLADRRRDDAWELECGDLPVRWYLARERLWWRREGLRMPQGRGVGNRSERSPLTFDEVQSRLREDPFFAGPLVNVWARRMGVGLEEARGDLGERFSGDLAVGTWSSSPHGRWTLTASHVWVVRASTAEVVSTRPTA